MRIALVGDVHEDWTVADSVALDRLDYDLVLFVGDLGDALHRRTLQVARRLATLRTPALLIPGNHDATSPIGVLAEALNVGRHRPGATRRGRRRLAALRAALGPVELAGYSAHPLPTHDALIIAARPHAMDGRRLCFPAALSDQHGIRTMAESTARLCALVDEHPGRPVFLAHNGPAGRGAHRGSPWGHARRDLGDPDLSAAVRHAAHIGRPALAVLAGHMHHDGTNRRWNTQQDGVLYVNAAMSPRARGHGPDRETHHVEIRLDDGTASARAVWVAA